MTVTTCRTHGVLDLRDAFRLPGLQRGVGQNPNDLMTVDDDKMMEAPQAHQLLRSSQRFPGPDGFDRRAHDVFESHVELGSLRMTGHHGNREPGVSCVGRALRPAGLSLLKTGRRFPM